MYRLLTVRTEVNDLKVTIFGKCFLEYPEEENHNYLQDQAEIMVSKLIGISKFKLKEAGNYLWDYENYDEEKHSNLDIMDLDDVYEPMFTHSS
tara:strand:- start:46 stop:324 length:279 start_codon:yes stop_codon:yes gene_type:complete